MQWNGRDNILKYVRILLSKARNTTTGLRQMIQKRTVEMLQAISLNLHLSKFALTSTRSLLGQSFHMNSCISRCLPFGLHHVS